MDTVEICYRETGEVIFEQAAGEEPRRVKFSEKFACKTCDITFPDLEPRMFSFNSPFGACPKCQGFGNVVDYDMDLVIPDPGLTINQGAIAPWMREAYTNWLPRLKSACPMVAGVAAN